MAVLDLSNGSRIRTFTLPPDGFDPLNASAAELAVYGFPERPTDPRFLARFNGHYSRLKGRLRCIEPTFTLRPSLRPAKVAGADDVAGATVPFWSGAVVYAPQGESFQWMQAEWVVPNVSTAITAGSAIGTTASPYTAVSWVGLGNSSLLQAGAGGQISPNGTPSFFLWHEWLPPGWVTINNLPVNAGDLITVMICTPSGKGSTSSTIYFSNNTQGLQTSYNLSWPNVSGSTPFLGDQAEWIVERPAVTGGLAILPNYGDVFFSSANAVLTNGTAVNAGTPGGNNGSIQMVANGITLSTGTIVAPTIVQCQYNGPVDGIISVA
jgi:hypothetical protein